MQAQKVISIGFDAEEDDSLFAAPERDLFRDNELLTGISEETYAQMVEKTEIVQYSPREIIFEEDEPGDFLYLVAQGCVKISKRGRAGQQETLTMLTERDFFGEMALVDNGKRSAQASAVGHVVLGRIDRNAWDLLMRHAPHEMLANFTRSVTRRVRANNQHFIEQMMRNERLSLLGTTINSIVHDMNNPIACILGACEVMQTKTQDGIAEQMAGLIREGVEKMQTMTRELLDFSRGNTKLDIQTITVREFLQALEPEFALCRPRVEVRVEALYEGPLRADKHRLQRLFANLIRNAREAMKAAPKKLLHVTVQHVDMAVRFEISDTGCGIPAPLLPRIFEPFTSNGQSKGAGLGLAIGKAVVEAHGGSIGVASSENGTTFHIILPLDA
ncbi:MAG: ATP-binding protein [Verrucomicrobiota bacterium]|nr:ATP-binding protein [Verrucomicrobiota bacterium]